MKEQTNIYTPIVNRLEKRTSLWDRMLVLPDNTDFSLTMLARIMEAGTGYYGSSDYIRQGVPEAQDAYNMATEWFHGTYRLLDATLKLSDNELRSYMKNVNNEAGGMINAYQDVLKQIDLLARYYPKETLGKTLEERRKWGTFLQFEQLMVNYEKKNALVPIEFIRKREALINSAGGRSVFVTQGLIDELTKSVGVSQKKWAQHYYDRGLEDNSGSGMLLGGVIGYQVGKHY